MNNISENIELLKAAVLITVNGNVLLIITRIQSLFETDFFAALYVGCAWACNCRKKSAKPNNIQTTAHFHRAQTLQDQ